MATLKNTVIDDTGYFKIPAGTTAQRPVSPSNGMMRYNSDTSLVEFWNGASWINVNDSSVYVNALTKYTYTIASATAVVSGADDNSNTLTYATDDSKNIEVYVNGIKLVEGASNDYTATNGTTVSLGYEVPVGSVVEIQVYSIVPVASIQSQWTTSGSNIYYNTGNVGIGTASPSYKLDVAGQAKMNSVIFPDASTTPGFKYGSSGLYVLTIGGYRSGNASSFTLFDIKGMGGNSFFIITINFGHAGGGIHGSYRRFSGYSNAYTSIQVVEDTGNVNYGGGNGFTISKPDTTTVRVQWDGATSFSDAYTLFCKIETSSGGAYLSNIAASLG